MLKNIRQAGFVLVCILGSSAIAHSAIANSPFLVAQRSNCRKILSEGITPFYRTLPDANTFSGVLDKGAKVGVSGNEETRAPNGLFYLRVSSPYNSSNAVSGYIPAETRLGNCEGRRARW